MKNFASSLFRSCLLLAASLSSVGAVRAQNAVVRTTLHTFGGSDGSQPAAGLVRDAAGNLYGTTTAGGENNYGTVFKITPAGDYTVLHDFDGSTGASPDTTLVLGSDGNLYGTTSTSITNGKIYGAGTMFRVTPAGAFTFLHSFDDPSGGSGNGLILGGDGSFYGTTVGGGATSQGTVFRITPQGAYSVLYTFSGGDGALPYAPLVLGVDGNFYGTTSGGGAHSLGTVFQLTPGGTLTTLHSFDGSDGNEPHAALLAGNTADEASTGDFYGVTYHGGLYGYNGGNGGAGVVFHVTSAGAYEVLHNFNGTDGAFPAYGLTLGNDGYFYGTTSFTVFQIDTRGEFMLIYDLGAGGGNGTPSGLVQDADGGFYATVTGNDYQAVDGSVFKLTIGPVPSSFFAGQIMLGNGYYYLNYDTVHPYGYDFGYYVYLEDRHYIYNTVLGYEYVFDAADGQNGVYLYDFKSQDFFYTSPSYPYPYLYDFGLQSVIFHFSQPEMAGQGYDPVDNRYFYVFSTKQIIEK